MENENRVAFSHICRFAQSLFKQSNFFNHFASNLPKCFINVGNFFNKEFQNFLALYLILLNKYQGLQKNIDIQQFLGPVKHGKK